MRESKGQPQFYGWIFAGVGLIGSIITFFGAIAAFIGLRRRKGLA